MEAFLVSIGIVALAEMGDKTQLLALMLAARYRQYGAIIAGIFIATLANHALAAAAGAWVTTMVDPEALRWIVGISFIAMGVWALIPDKLDKKDKAPSRLGPFAFTLVSFFLIEMGDKTQLTTIALAARYSVFVAVVFGTTLGMMIANVPAVLLGNKLIAKIPLRTVHVIAAATFVGLGLLVLLSKG